jgi:hypothetical protein
MEMSMTTMSGQSYGGVYSLPADGRFAADFPFGMCVLNGAHYAAADNLVIIGD